MDKVAHNARRASRVLQSIESEIRNEIIAQFHDELQRSEKEIFDANQNDCTIPCATAPLLRRLRLTPDRFQSSLDGMLSIIKMDDPVGKSTLEHNMAPNLDLTRVTCPLGVVAVIFEARPEVGIQIITLCVKTANALILKGGREAADSNLAIVNCFRKALENINRTDLDDIVQLIDNREDVQLLLKETKNIDLVIPRGGKELVKFIMQNTQIPVLGHADGLCAIYVHEDARLDMAVEIIEDAKLNYTSACNAVETLLVHKSISHELLPMLAAKLEDVKFLADAHCLASLPEESCKLAVESDYNQEFLCKKLAVKAVDTVAEAIEHINTHGSHHTDCIITEDRKVADQFMNAVDSAGVYHNCSTRFADGYRYGFGAEVGISTNKIHARGPVGLEGLLIYKYKLYGSGHTVDTFNVKPYLSMA